MFNVHLFFLLLRYNIHGVKCKNLRCDKGTALCKAAPVMTVDSATHTEGPLTIHSAPTMARGKHDDAFFKPWISWLLLERHINGTIH